VNLPRWDDQKLNLGSMVRTALWLTTVIGEGNKFSMEDLRDAFPQVAQISRRMRDLRDYDWVIATSREDPTLSPNEFRLVRAGVPVWDADSRAKGRVSMQVQEKVRPSTFTHKLFSQAEPDALDMVREQLAGLPHDDKVLVLAWLVKGRRDHAPAEQAFDAAQMLPSAARRELMAQLADEIVGRIKETPPMTD
jgi:hypothetical protein